MHLNARATRMSGEETLSVSEILCRRLTPFDFLFSGKRKATRSFSEGWQEDDVLFV